MRRKMMSIAAFALLAIAATVQAGDGIPMKCEAKPDKDSETGEISKPCGYESYVTFGGGMLFDQITGYCRSCKKFVYLSWTSENIPAELKTTFQVRPRPEPLGEVWDAQTGKIMTIHACPNCKGPFQEIKSPDEFKYCPVCNKPHFVVDESKPRMAID